MVEVNKWGRCRVGVGVGAGVVGAREAESTVKNKV